MHTETETLPTNHEAANAYIFRGYSTQPTWALDLLAHVYRLSATELAPIAVHYFKGSDPEFAGVMAARKRGVARLRLDVSLALIGDVMGVQVPTARPTLPPLLDAAMGPARVGHGEWARANSRTPAPAATRAPRDADRARVLHNRAKAKAARKARRKARRG